MKLLILFASLPLSFLWAEEKTTIVDPAERVSDTEAHFELGKLLFRQPSKREDALQQFFFVLNEDPNSAKGWLEVSRLLIATGDFTQALTILMPLVAHQPIPFKQFSLPKPTPSTQEATIVEKAISDEEAKHTLAQLLGKHNATIDEALSLYQSLIEKKPDDVKLLLEIGRLFLRKKEFTIALNTLYFALEMAPTDPEILTETAHAEMGLEHAVKAHCLILQALQHSEKKEPLLLDLASVYMLVGSFYKAEALYAEALESNPHDLDLALKLAWSLVSAQRYEEAEEFYRHLLDEHACNDKIIEALAVLKKIEKDFSTALEWVEMGCSPNSALLKGEILYQKGCYQEALQAFKNAIYSVKDSGQAWLGKGKAERKLRDCEAAEQSFKQALNDPESYLEARFYLTRIDSACIGQWMQEINKPSDLLALANFYAENGMGGILSFYQAALEIDPDYFPARTGLAEAYSANYLYEESIAIYLSILEDFPDNSKIMIAVARVLSWWKRYEASLNWYDDVIALNPKDPLPRREKARVAYWGKFFCLSMKTYGELLQPPFNQRVQTAARLERDSKAMDWQNYFLHALPIYENLIEYNPGNQEALYGYAQDLCSLGRCLCSRQIYNHLLNLEPNSDIVKMALQRNLLREHPLVQGNYTYWTEQGSGQFANSQIARQQFDELVEWSPSCDLHFRFMQHEWLEYPFLKHRYYPAEGQTIEVDHVFNSFMRGVASATRKNYFQRFPTRYTCLATLWFNVFDYFNLGIGFERKNEIYNYFTLQQGIQAKIYWATVRAYSHAWTIETTYRHFDYNDQNTLKHVNLMASYILTDDPVTFKLIANANYRDATHLTEIIINDEGELVNIIHPYWTPENYYSESLTLEFRYNYAWFTYCEAPNRYIDLKLTGENDTAHNPSFQLIFNWKHEWFRHFGFEITALYHRSKLWNADGIWTQVYYRF